MNIGLLLAGILSLLLGAGHSVLGEALIFKRLKIQAEQEGWLSKRHVAALWSTWHLVTLLGWGMGATLIYLSQTPSTRLGPAALAVVSISAVTFLASAIFWLFGARGRHPAWMVLLAIAALTWWAVH